MVLSDQFDVQFAVLLPQKDAFAHLWSLISGAIALDSETFQHLHTEPHSLLAALTIVFIAGFSQALSQIVVLFINQVRPLRFVLSLLISALFFVIGYGFWALSTWAILNLTFAGPLPLSAVLQTLGFSYTPLMLGLFVMLPYFGSAVFLMLSIWTLLAVVVGIEAITPLERWDAFSSAALGWVILQLLQKTVGQPVAALRQWITNWVAGEELITNRTHLAEELYTGLRAQRATPELMTDWPRSGRGALLGRQLIVQTNRTRFQPHSQPHPQWVAQPRSQRVAQQTSQRASKQVSMAEHEKSEHGNRL